MSARPSRRAAASRRRIAETDSDNSEVEGARSTPVARESRRSVVGSRTSFNDEYSPKKARPRVAKTPAKSKNISGSMDVGRTPLSEAKKGRLQSQTPATQKQQTNKAAIDRVKEGYEGKLVHDMSQKENAAPFSHVLKPDMPPPVPLSARASMYQDTTRSINMVDTKTTDQSLVAQAVQEVAKGPRTRIVISKLVLENFKSYAGVQRIGPFHKSFSAVVGPNGSGKSNVIDSLLFVFGFRASKMRQGKVSALIHNSAAHPDLSHCSVEVHFETIYDTDDPKDYRVVSESSIIIARKAYKNNSSKYTINGRESSFTEVTTLLKDRGIDLDHKRFLILQGEVESIAQMRPKAANEHDDGLLEYLEDIIGTSKYKAPIEGAVERMEALNDICQEKNSRLQLVEKERARLEVSKDNALRQVRTENELAVRQSILYQIFVSECATNISVTEECMEELQREMQNGLESFKGNEGLITELEQKHRAATKYHEELKSLLSKYLAEAAKAEKLNVSVQERMKHLSSKQKKLLKSNTTTEHSLRESTRQGEALEVEILKFEAELTALRIDLAKNEEELEKIRFALKDKTQVYADQIEIKQKQKRPSDLQISDHQSALKVASSELEILSENALQTDKDLEVANAELETLRATNASKQDEIKARQNEAAQCAVSLSEKLEQLSQLQKLEAMAKMEHSGAREKADEAHSNLSASKQKGDVLLGLSNLQESGRISGFHGRLGDLGTIDDKYDIAITTACPSLNNIVVDNVDVGQKCIEHLRRNNLGRANFILLDKLPPRDLNKVPTPENVHRLVDLVKPRHNDFLPAFMKVLGNTVVAQSLEQANRIAYGKTRWRVVTLDGQLIESSGAMTGGGSKVSKGGMSSKFATSETKESVAKLEKLESMKKADLERIHVEINTLETEITQLQANLPKLKVQISRLDIETKSFEKQQKEHSDRIKELSQSKKTSNTDADRRQELERLIVTHQQAIVNLQKENAGIEEDIRTLQDKILEIGGIRLRSQKSKVDGLHDQIEALTQRCETNEFSKARADKDVKKCTKALQAGQAELATIEEDLQKLGEGLKDDDSSTELSKEIEETKYAIEECASNIGEIKKTLDIESEHINAHRAKELDLRNQLEDHKKRQSEDKAKHSHWSEKISKLAIQELSAYFVDKDEPMQQISVLSDDELSSYNKSDLKAEIAVLEESTQNASIDTGVLDDYQRRCEEHEDRAQALQEAVHERDVARNTADDLRRRRLTEFMTGFNLISLRLKEMYQMITMGGNAELELVDSLDPFSEGILFSVMPPKKSWKNISNLSGGEKTLSSLALVFALHHYKPTPLYVMDEIDAALDFRNVSIVANYIKDRTKNAQFIVISLRNNMFELSARLIGIYKTSNMTKSIAIENTEIPKPDIKAE